ncbi:HEXXH motif-containing putative peptide modification protein [Saccharothrix sp.]|uniref:aKG-HExxH-type peptide beta-hydroxylase n=1 Tax=Saccharothrix sp. TaxID=1873460 RepID=UPI002810F94A|nr:HEXXH motif-containing putative peptide modification protein [Saccharothrix sp.]
MKTFAEEAAASSLDLGPFHDIGAAWALLAKAEDRAPYVVEDVLLYPTVGVWLARALRQVLGMAVDSTPLWSEVGGFHALAAAAAFRAGLEFAVPVPVVHGAVALPTVGVLRLATAFPVGAAVLRGTSAGLVVEVAGASVEVVHQSLRVHHTAARGRRVRMVLDDLDPYREFSSPVPPRPLSHDQRAEWCKYMDEAWDMLTHEHPEWAEELAAGLRNVVPLAAEERVFAASSTAAFGSIAMSPKESAVHFAEALVHEIQHSKVNALLELLPLADDDRVARYYAPWLDYPRPVTALLHGVYAFCSVVEFWHVQRKLVPEEMAVRGEYAFVYRHRQVTEVLGVLRRLPELTEPGRRFAAGVAVRLAACSLDDARPEVVRAVECITDEHRALWRLRHVRPDPTAVRALAAAWRRGSTAYTTDVPHELVPAGEGGRTLLSTLAEARLKAPDEYLRGVDPAGAEAAYLAGDRRRAARLWEARVTANPSDLAAWCGLGRVVRSKTLRDRPELVRALYVALAGAGGPTPTQLAAWSDLAAS